MRLARIISTWRSVREAARRPPQGGRLLSAGPYAASATMVALATAMTWLIWPWIAPQVSPLFIAAVLLSAWYGGLYPSLFASLLASLITIYFFVPPIYTFTVDLADVLRLATFFLVAVLMSWCNAMRNRAEQSLRQAYAGLEQRVEQRTAELRDSEQQLRALASELALSEERERRRIAHHLHDEVGQLLSLAQIKLDVHLQIQPHCTMRDDIEQVRKLLDRSLGEMRDLTCQIGAPMLYELGLFAGLQWLCEQAGRNAGITVTCRGPSTCPSMSDEQSIVLYQVARELLRNIAKHSKATSAQVVLEFPPGAVHLRVEDNGIGFDPCANPGPGRAGASFGIFGVRQRLKNYEGELCIESARGAGTCCTIRMPRLMEGNDDGGSNIPGRRPQHDASRAPQPAGEPRGLSGGG